MNCIEKQADRFAAFFVSTPPTQTSLTACNFSELESSVRTGDILLFNDVVSVPDRRRDCVAYLTKCMSFLPCLAFAIMAQRIQPIAEDKVTTTPRGDKPGLPNEWLDWQQAALIVCFPQQNDQRAEQAFVFVDKRLWLLRDFVNSFDAKKKFFAIRHLLINEEAVIFDTNNIANRRLVSQRRARLRDHIADFQRQMCQPTARTMRDDSFQTHNSNSFVTLCTLFKTRVLRAEPRFDDAVQLLQERNTLLFQAQMNSDFCYTEEQLFFIQK